MTLTDKTLLFPSQITKPGVYLDFEGDVWLKREDRPLMILTIDGSRAGKQDRRYFREDNYTFVLLHEHVEAE
jgi:hypothetical protein